MEMRPDDPDNIDQVGPDDPDSIDQVGSWTACFFGGPEWVGWLSLDALGFSAVAKLLVWFFRALVQLFKETFSCSR